ncbi:MAG: tetratricopeptide repeat protein [Verrucomicrobia bacterium]|nr:tetratricopeptide repeat protein [Verrucomicrobiota bacterium]MCH8525978.1 tetratricopeptide repeat protein [Kiritimatiellia bacterium]
MYEAMVDVQDGLYEIAIPKLESVIEGDPTEMGAWESLGWAYWLTGRPDQAKSLWEQLVTIAPQEPMGYNLLAQVATRDADFKTAIELYRTSLRLNPDQFEIRLSLARNLLWDGQHQESLGIFQRLLAEDPDRLDVEIDLAWALYVDEQYEEVIDYWDRINEAIPDNPNFLLARANVLVLLGELNLARMDAEHALELEPENADALNLLAGLAMRRQSPAEAVEAMEAILDITEEEETQAQVHLRIAAYMHSVSQRDPSVFSTQDILRHVRRSLDLDDTKVGTHMVYGEMLMLNRQFSAAHDAFTHILEEFNPMNLRARFGLVETYFGRMMLDDVERQLRDNFRAFNPNNPFRHLLWARLAFARGNFSEAMEHLDRLELEGSQGSVFTLLYHGINPSEFSDMPSARQVREHLIALRRSGFRFITPSDLEDYFDAKVPATLSDERPWLYRMVRGVQRAWSGITEPDLDRLSDYSPDKVVMVTFDDGMRNSFRYGSQIAQDLGIPMTMFIGIGDVLNQDLREIATFSEMREFKEQADWEFHSHLWDAGQLEKISEDGREGLPIPNRLWLEDRGRMETLREYQRRLTREFRDARRVLIREFNLSDEDVFAVAYPLGEVGQELDTNIRAFDVTRTVLNESEIHYRMGFVQHQFGYSMKTDDRMLLKRFEPDREASGRDVLRAAFIQHPVFLARRTRVEMATLQGELHMALRNIELLKRDGYPEEEIAILNGYVRERLGRLMPLPEGAEDLTEEGDSRPWISLRRPYIGADAMVNRANEVIDDREFSVFAGVNLNRRTAFQGRYGIGRIKQTISTNRFITAQRTTSSSSVSNEQRIQNGDVSNVRVISDTTQTVTVQSNVLDRTFYEADKSILTLRLSYTHDDGSFTLGTVGVVQADGSDINDESKFIYGIEHQWRPVPAIDIAAFYNHGLVPSAREMLSFDSLGIRPFWRIRDDWQSVGLAYFAYYEDRNSYIRTEMENYWRISRPYDFWIGLHNSLETMDQDSDLYFSPFWDQRHYLIFRLRRTLQNYFSMFRVNVGYAKSDVRREEKDRFANAAAQGEAEGWSPGSGPDTGWNRLLGFSANLTRTWENGFEVSGELNVNSTNEYTEHTAMLRLMYAF